LRLKTQTLQLIIVERMSMTMTFLKETSVRAFKTFYCGN
jgi:hypothetical protein